MMEVFGMSSDAQAKECQAMAKQQRSVQLPPDIYKLCEMYEAGTGIKFNRQVTAALLAYFFADLVECAPGTDVEASPAVEWMRYATTIERGRVEIDDLPLALLDARIESLERSLLAVERGDAVESTWWNARSLQASLDVARSRRAIWQNRIADFKHPSEVLKHYLTPFAE